MLSLLGLQAFCKAVLFCPFAKFFATIFQRRKPMKQPRRFCAGVILALSLTLSAYAGHIPCPGITDDQSGTTQETTTEETATGEMQNSVEYTDPVTELAISLLTTLLPII
jgi:hypothetical protein